MSSAEPVVGAGGFGRASSSSVNSPSAGIVGRPRRRDRSGLQPASMVKPAADWTERSLDLSRLLARAGLGDRAAFATLYERTSSHLFAVVLRINRDRAQAEDILQEVYVNVWRAAQSFDAAQSQPLTWLTSIARNRAIDSLRRAADPAPGCRPRRCRRAAPTTEDDDVYDTVADDSARPARSAEPGRRMRARSRACMDQLERAQRQSVALAFYQGLSHAEVADADAPAARHRQVVGAARAADAEELPRRAPCARDDARRLNVTWTTAAPSSPTASPPSTWPARCAAARGAASRALLPAHPALREATRAWQERLMPLTAAIAPVAAVGRGLAAHLGAASAAAKPRRRAAAPGTRLVVLARPGRVRQRRGDRPRGAARQPAAGRAADRRRARADRRGGRAASPPRRSSPASAATARRW